MEKLIDEKIEQIKNNTCLKEVFILWYPEYIKILFEDGWWYARLEKGWYIQETLSYNGLELIEDESFEAEDVFELEMQYQEITEKEYNNFVYQREIRFIEERIEKIKEQTDNEIKSLEETKTWLLEKVN